MRRVQIITLVILICSVSILAQKTEEKKKQATFQVGLGAGITSFQDTKFSDVRYNGLGTNLSFGFEKLKKNYFSTNLNLIFSNENPKTHDFGKTSVVNGVIDLSYLKPVLKKEHNELYLGLKWDVMDFYYRNTEGLGNNSDYYVFGSNLNLSSFYQRKISEVATLRCGASLQLFSFMKESMSFSFSTAQNILEDGKFNYQADDMDSPTNFEHYSFETLNKYINIKTFAELHYKRRWVLAYNWNMQRSNLVKNYPMTRGYNLLSLKYKF